MPSIWWRKSIDLEKNWTKAEYVTLFNFYRPNLIEWSTSDVRFFKDNLRYCFLTNDWNTDSDQRVVHWSKYDSQKKWHEKFWQWKLTSSLFLVAQIKSYWAGDIIQGPRMTAPHPCFHSIPQWPPMQILSRFRHLTICRAESNDIWPLLFILEGKSNSWSRTWIFDGGRRLIRWGNFFGGAPELVRSPKLSPFWRWPCRDPRWYRWWSLLRGKSNGWPCWLRSSGMHQETWGFVLHELIGEFQDGASSYDP